MRIALLHDHYDEKHLADVKAEMKKLGAPTIKAVYLAGNDHYAALEGTHRILAAKDLGLVPIIDTIDYDKTKDDFVDGMQDDFTVAEICDRAYQAKEVCFND